MSVNPWKSTPQWIGAIICRRFSKVSHRFEAKMWGLSLLAIFTFRQTAKQSVFLRIQVCTSSQTKGLERGWKQRARLGRDAFSPASHALRGCEDRALRTRKTLTPRFTLCVFIGNLSSKTLKYHISLMTYDLKFLLLWERGGIRWLLMRVLQKQLRVLPRWFRYCLSWPFLWSTFQYYTCQLFLSQMREIFTLSWPGFPETSRPLLEIYDDFPKSSKRCRKCPQIFRRRLSNSEAI